MIIDYGRGRTHGVEVLDHRLVAFGRRYMQRRLSVAVLEIHVGTVIDQDPGHLDVFPSGGQMQCRVAIVGRGLNREGRIQGFRGGI